MRVQVAVAVAAFLATTTARGDRSAGWLSVYTDDDGLTVWSPQVGARVEVGDDLEAEVGYDADIISAATVDLVTAASPRGYDEVRHGAIVGVSYEPWQGASVGVSYLPSTEPDYASHALVGSVSQEWHERTVTTALSYRYNADSVGRAGDSRSSWKSLEAHGVRAEVAWVIDRTTLAQLSYELNLRNGFMASPYRFVSVHWLEPTQTVVSVPEQVPDSRSVHALAFGLRRAFTSRWFGSYSYRIYADTWQVVSHTAEVGIDHVLLSDDLVLGIAVRGYAQSAAEFYRRRYVAAVATLPRYRAADKMLASSWSLLPSARGEYDLGPVGPLDPLSVTVKVGVYDQHFLDFDPLPARRGFIGSIGAAAEF